MPYSEATPAWPKYSGRVDVTATGMGMGHVVQFQYEPENMGEFTQAEADAFFQAFIDHLNDFPGVNYLMGTKSNALQSEVTPAV